MSSYEQKYLLFFLELTSSNSLADFSSWPKDPLISVRRKPRIESAQDTKKQVIQNAVVSR